MSAAAVLTRLRMDGFAVIAADDRLIVKPASRLTDDHRALIRQHREDLLELLRDPDPRVTCVACTAFRPGRCARHRAAGLFSPEIGRDFAALPQRCGGFRRDA